MGRRPSWLARSGRRRLLQQAPGRCCPGSGTPRGTTARRLAVPGCSRGGLHGALHTARQRVTGPDVCLSLSRRPPRGALNPRLSALAAASSPPRCRGPLRCAYLILGLAEQRLSRRNSRTTTHLLSYTHTREPAAGAAGAAAGGERARERTNIYACVRARAKGGRERGAACSRSHLVAR